jgi:hypothetical protein
MERDRIEATPMPPQAVCKVKEIDPATRDLLKQLFGRDLPADQKILFTLLDVSGATAAPARQEAWATINRILDKAAENMKDLPEAEFEAAVEEAMEQVRPRRTQ